MESLKTISAQSSIDIDQPELGSLLVLKKTSSNSKTLSVEFDFVGSSQKESSSNWSVSDFLPTFNTDHKFYTPTFILKMDKEKYMIRDKVYCSLHRDRVQSNLDQETSDLRVAKPFQFHNYCMVCKRDFHDYQKHTKSDQHHKKMIKSEFCKDIDSLCLGFGNKSESHDEEIAMKMLKTKKIRKIGKSAKWIQNVETKCEFESIY